MIHDRLQSNANEKAKEFASAKEVETQQQKAKRIADEKSAKAQVRSKLVEKIPALTNEKGELHPAVKAAGAYAVRILSHVVKESQKETAALQK